MAALWCAWELEGQRSLGRNDARRLLPLCSILSHQVCPAAFLASSWRSCTSLILKPDCLKLLRNSFRHPGHWKDDILKVRLNQDSFRRVALATSQLFFVFYFLFYPPMFDVSLFERVEHRVVRVFLVRLVKVILGRFCAEKSVEVKKGSQEGKSVGEPSEEQTRNEQDWTEKKKEKKIKGLNWKEEAIEKQNCFSPLGNANSVLIHMSQVAMRINASLFNQN